MAKDPVPVVSKATPSSGHAPVPAVISELLSQLMQVGFQCLSDTILVYRPLDLDDDHGLGRGAELGPAPDFEVRSPTSRSNPYLTFVI